MAANICEDLGSCTIRGKPAQTCGSAAVLEIRALTHLKSSALGYPGGPPCPLPVPSLSPLCPLSVHSLSSLSPVCSLSVPFCPLLVLPVPCLFPLCSLCSLSVFPCPLPASFSTLRGTQTASSASAVFQQYAANLSNRGIWGNVYFQATQRVT